MTEVAPQNISGNIKYLSFMDANGTRKVVEVTHLVNNKCCYTFKEGEAEKQFRGKIATIESRVDEPSVKVKLANLLQDTVILPAELYGIPGSDLRISLPTLRYIE